MKIALVNQSTQLSNTDAQLIAAAVDCQLKQHFCPSWELAPSSMTYFADVAHVPAGFDVMLVKNVIDDPQALGYHTENGGIISSLIATDPVVKAGGVALMGANLTVVTFASVISHEACEMVRDPNCNRWVDGPTVAQGSCYSEETCDPVESDSYEILVNGKPVAVSNFVLPPYFDPQNTTGPFDWLHKLSTPFTMTSGGYMVVRAAPGSEQQVFGDTYAEWRKDRKNVASSRMSRRCS